MGREESMVGVVCTGDPGGNADGWSVSALGFENPEGSGIDPTTEGAGSF